MEVRLQELIDQEFLSLEELEEVEEHELVINVETLGASGNHVGYKWYNVILENGKEYSVYTK